jgi:hypothetical protein
MRRYHLFEFHDQPWCPAFVRDAMTECLRVFTRVIGMHKDVARYVRPVLRKTRVNTIIDLCSGAGGPAVELYEELGRDADVVLTVLTDLYPNQEAFRKAKRKGLHACVLPVDVTSVPYLLTGLRTLCNAFHHFKLEDARRILGDAYAKRQPIAIFEVTGRGWLRAVGTGLGSAVLMPLLLPFMCRQPLATYVLSYIIPVIPLLFGWDAFVSCLRTYTTDEVRDMTEDLREGYLWKVGIDGGMTYCVGLPA